MSVSIRYWDRESWADYFKRDVLPLYESALTILYLWRELKERADGMFLSDVIRDMPSLELIFVGGTTPPDKYNENGLAYVYKELFGTDISLREYYFLRKYGREPKTKCKVEKTIVVHYIDHIAVLLERVLTRVRDLELIGEGDIEKAREAARRASMEVLAKPESIAEKLAELLNRALRLTIIYNEYTRFIWYLHKIPKMYMREFFPELLKPEVFKFIQELLGLREYIVPQVEDPEIADLYTIYSYDYLITAHIGVGELRYSDRIEYHEYISSIDGVPVGRDDVLRMGALKYITGGDLIEQVCVYRSCHDYPKLSFQSTEEPYHTVGGCLCRVNTLIKRLFGQESLRLVVDDIPRPYAEWDSLMGKLLKNVPKRKEKLYRLPYPESYEALSWLEEFLPEIFLGRCEPIIRDYPQERKLVYITCI